MARRIWSWSLTLLAWLALLNVGASQDVPASAVAYLKNNSLTITAKHGEVLDTILMRPAVSDFSVSRDRRSIVVVSNSTAHGGDLELIDLRHKRRTKLLSAPVYFTHLEGEDREVYAGPHISPDGKQVVFTVHLETPAGAPHSTDVAGPLAILNIGSGDVHVMQSTNIENRPCDAKSPQWSPEGSQIVFNCETGSAITSLDGSTLRRLPTGTEQKPWSAVIGWLGNRCVLYVQATNGASYDTYDLRWLNLVTSETQDASGLVARQRAKVPGLSEVSSDAAISRTSQVAIHTPFNHWVLPKDSPAHLLSGWPRDTVPQPCR